VQRRHQVQAGVGGEPLLPGLIRDANVASHAATTSIGDRMSERTLILLRHAKSDWSGDEADIARPLAKRGRRQATGNAPH